MNYPFQLLNWFNNNLVNILVNNWHLMAYWQQHQLLKYSKLTDISGWIFHDKTWQKERKIEFLFNKRKVQELSSFSYSFIVQSIRWFGIKLKFHVYLLSYTLHDVTNCRMNKKNNQISEPKRAKLENLLTEKKILYQTNDFII